MLAVKQQKPEVQKLLDRNDDENDDDGNNSVQWVVNMMMMINVKIWDRVARLMDHLEERRAEDKYVKCQINRSEHFDTQMCFNQPTTTWSDLKVLLLISKYHDTGNSEDINL